MPLDSIEAIIHDISQGKMIVLMDDEDRENEGDLICAAQKVTPEHINFMARFGRGLICMPLTPAKSEQLNLPLMVNENDSRYGTNFTVSIEAATGVTTGISASDRAKTIQAACASFAQPKDIVQPGHVFPIVAKPGGVLARAGHTEATCDLAQLGGLEPCGVLCEILNEDGTMARRPQLEVFAKEHQLKIGTVADLIAYRLKTESTIKTLKTIEYPTQWGPFKLVVFQDTIHHDLHFALVRGTPNPNEKAYVRVHVKDTLFDLPGLQMGQGNRWPLKEALKVIAQKEHGALVVLNIQESQQDILNKVNHFGAHKKRLEIGLKSKEWRLTGLGSQILSSLGFERLVVLSQPKRLTAIDGFGLKIEEYLSYQEESRSMECVL